MWQILIVVLGMIFGLILKRIAKEEIKNGKRYFLIIEKILLVSLIALVLFFIKLSVLLLIGLVIGVIICRAFKKVYFYLGILVLSSFLINKELFLAGTSFIFLFSLVYNSLNKFNLRNLILNIILFILPFSFLIVESFINAKIGFLVGVGIGGIIMWALSSAW